MRLSFYAGHSLQPCFGHLGQWGGREFGMGLQILWPPLLTGHSFPTGYPATHLAIHIIPFTAHFWPTSHMTTDQSFILPSVHHSHSHWLIIHTPTGQPPTLSLISNPHSIGDPPIPTLVKGLSKPTAACVLPPVVSDPYQGLLTHPGRVTAMTMMGTPTPEARTQMQMLISLAWQGCGSPGP